MPACEFPKKNASSEEIKQILTSSKSIAVVGLSPKPDRPSHRIYQYLKSAGFTVYGVNPGHTSILGDKVYSSLLEIPERIDIVDIFRSPDAVPALVDESIQINARVVWMQEGIVHNEAADKARSHGIHVVMNKCIYLEHRSLL